MLRRVSLVASARSLSKAVRVFRSFGNRQEIRLGLSFQKHPTIVPLNSDILNAGFDFIRRSRAFVMGTTCMFSAPFQQYFFCLSPDGEVAIRPEILTTQFFIFFLLSSHGFDPPSLFTTNLIIERRGRKLHDVHWTGLLKDQKPNFFREGFSLARISSRFFPLANPFSQVASFLPVEQVMSRNSNETRFIFSTSPRDRLRW